MVSRRTLLSLTVVFGLVASSGFVGAAETVLCRTVRAPKATNATPAFRPYTRLRVRDRIMPNGRTVDVRKPASACFAVGVDGADVSETNPLTGYRTHPSRTKPAQPRLDPFALDVAAPWGTESLRMSAVDDLVAPATIAGAADDPGPAPDRTHLACYEARSRQKVGPRIVTLSGDHVPSAVEVSRPVRVCVTADFGGADPTAPGKHEGWLCLAARLPRGANRASTDPAQGETLVFRDSFGRTAMTLGATSELCVPVTIGAPDAVATPTATITPEAPTPTPTPTPSPEPTADTETLFRAGVARRTVTGP